MENNQMDWVKIFAQGDIELEAKIRQHGTARVEAFYSELRATNRGGEAEVISKWLGIAYQTAIDRLEKGDPDKAIPALISAKIIKAENKSKPASFPMGVPVITRTGETFSL